MIFGGVSIEEKQFQEHRSNGSRDSSPVHVSSWWVDIGTRMSLILTDKGMCDFIVVTLGNYLSTFLKPKKA